MRKTTMIFLAVSIAVCSFCVFYAKNSMPTIEKTIVDTHNTDLLVQYDIVPENELGSEEYITVRDALYFIGRLCNYDTDYHEWMWANHEELEPLDSIPDEDKGLLFGTSELVPVHYRSPLLAEELFVTDLDEELKFGDALKYLTRLLSDDKSADMNKIFETAVKKGLISEKNTVLKDVPITRKDFYILAANASLVNYVIVNAHGGNFQNIAGELEFYKKIEEKARIAKEKEEQAEQAVLPLDIDVVIHDDMSVTWTVNDDEINKIKQEADRFDADITFFDEKDRPTGFPSMYYYYTDGLLRPQDMLFEFIDEYKPRKLQIDYTLFDEGKDTYDLQKRTKRKTITLPQVDAVTEGKALKGAKCTENNNGTFTISVAEDELKKDRYYILYSKKQDRLGNYSVRKNLLFSPYENGKICTVSYAEGASNLLYSDDMFENLKISEITIDGNAQNGFTLYMTPEADCEFKSELD